MTKNQSKFNFKMLSAGVAELYLYEEIGAFWGKSAKEFSAELADLGPVEEINVRINSMGGSVFDGFTIHSLLKNHAAKVVVHIDGIAASIASVIAMAGDEIRISENGFLMIHQPWTFAEGTAQTLREKADVLDKLQEQGVKIYADRSGLNEAEVLALMDNGVETWLNATEAISRGLADSMMESVEAVSMVVDRKLFPNAPASLKHRDTPGEAGEMVAKANAEAEAESIAIRRRLLDIETPAA